MKKLVCLAIGGAMMATVSMAQTNVLSQNAVGYVKVTVPANGGLALVRMDFNSIDGSPVTVSTAIGNQLPQSSVVHIWDAAANQYASPSSVLTRGGWVPNPTLNRGTGFWLQNASAGPEAQVYLMGEVPSALNGGGTTTVNNIDGVDLIGLPYPVSVAWTSTALSVTLPQGSVLHRWDSVGQSYVSPSSVKTRGGWIPAPGNIQPGQAFWVDLASNSGLFSWTVVKPYAWP